MLIKYLIQQSVDMWPWSGSDLLYSSGCQHPLAHNAHHQRMINILIATQKLCHASTPATLKAIDPLHCLTRIISIRDAPEVVQACSLSLGPANRFPLQRIVRHEVTLFVT